MMIIPSTIKEKTRVVGYFSYSMPNHAFCDGDACIIAGTEELMNAYLQKTPFYSDRNIIKKTRFGEIIDGIKRGGAYAFDEEAYGRFFRLAIINGISELSTPDVFLERSSLTGLHFVRIQVVGL